jgi:hypothetical protein
MTFTTQTVGWPIDLAVGYINLAEFAPPPLKRWATHSVHHRLTVSGAMLGPLE